jgi:CRP-like cAMP-binding protein
VRLTTLLLNLSGCFGETNGMDTLLGVRLTHQELANMIASTREAVSKVRNSVTFELRYPEDDAGEAARPGEP